MKRAFIVPLLLFAVSSFAATTAITENGDAVVLHEDGTWSFVDGDVKKDEEIPINKKKFKKSKSSSFRLKSKITNAAFWINPKGWKFSLTEDEDTPNEYTLNVPGTDLYGMVISEGIQVKPEELVKIAYSNAKSAAPDVKVKKKEYREVNGNQVIYMVMQGTIQSIDFTYMGYYFSNESGSTQLLAYTGSSLVNKYEDQIFELLNGFDTVE